MTFLAANPGFYIFGLHVAWYGVIIAFGMLVATCFCYAFSPKRGIKRDDIIVCGLWVIPLSIIGARVYFLIFSGGNYTFAEMFQIWNGGMAIYGGVIGGALGVLIHSLIKKQNFFDYGDVIAPFLLLAQAIGRWGNFVNQEAFGPAAGEGMHWFPLSVYIQSGNSLHAPEGWYLATFFYESMWNLIGFAILLTLLLKVKKRGVNVAGYFIFYGTGRALIESIRSDSLMIGSLKVSVLVSIILIAVGVAMLVYIFFLKDKVDFKKLFRRKKEPAVSGDVSVNEKVIGQKNSEIESLQKETEAQEIEQPEQIIKTEDKNDITEA